MLVVCTVFAPSIGGMETIAALVVRNFSAQGHTVTVLTRTASSSDDSVASAVLRRPSVLDTFRAFLETDAVVMIGLTLRLGWPLLVIRRVALVSHHCFAPPGDNRAARALRKFLGSRTKNVACSKWLAGSVGDGCLTVGNPYDERVFCSDESVGRCADLAFVGRLVPEKGPLVLLEALALLAEQGIRPDLTMIGSGPLREDLERKVEALGLRAQVVFTGQTVGGDLVRLLNKHRILVVPSSWEEPFGIVALEGIACGCAVIGSCGGGLPEAIGPCGLTFPRGDARGLAAAIRSLLDEPAIISRLRNHAPEHLARHTSEVVVKRYLEVLTCSFSTTQ